VAHLRGGGFEICLQNRNNDLGEYYIIPCIAACQ